MNGKKKEKHIIIFLAVNLMLFGFLGSVGFIDYLKYNLPLNNETEEIKEKDVVLNEFKNIVVKENKFSIPIGGKKFDYKFNINKKEILVNQKVILENIKSTDVYQIDDIILLKTISSDNLIGLYIVLPDGSLLKDINSILKDYQNNIIINSIDFLKTNVILKTKTLLGPCSLVNLTQMLNEGKCSNDPSTNSINCIKENDKVLESELNFTYSKANENKLVYTVIEEKTMFSCYQEAFGKINIAQ